VTRQDPIWGTGDELTLKVLSKLKLKGKWLNLAAGDGRYVPELLSKVSSIVATDINRKYLNKLRGKKRVQTKVADLTKKFPFKNDFFDGVFCTGTLHLFDKKVLESVFSEMDRVLKPKGKLIIDFATDIKRSLPSGKLKRYKDEPKYKLKPAKQMLKTLLKGYSVKLYESEWVDDLTQQPMFGYISNGYFILVVADKK